MKFLYNYPFNIIFIAMILLIAVIMNQSDITQSTPVTSIDEVDSIPIAQVKVTELKQGIIEQSIVVYGTVLPLPNKLKTISVPYISQVETIYVNQGQLVKPGDRLVSLKPGASALLQWQQAENELVAASQENKLLQQRITLKLATQQDLVNSQLRLKRAKVMLKNLADQGVNKTQQVRANSAGIIYLSYVQQGQIVPAGKPLLQLINQNQWFVRLGIEPEDYPHLHKDQPVLITPVNTPVDHPIKGRIKVITHQIDTSTRLLNIFVKPESNQSLLLNDFVQARIITASIKTLQVPFQAVLPDGDGYSLFTIEKGHAIKHQVHLGLQNEHSVELIDSDLKEHDKIVIQGNYELSPGMAVSIVSNNKKVAR